MDTQAGIIQGGDIGLFPHLVFKNNGPLLFSLVVLYIMAHCYSHGGPLYNGPLLFSLVGLYIMAHCYSHGWAFI